MANTDNLEDKKLLCVGLICLDVIHVCNSYPFEGTDQRIKKMTWQKGGNAANTSAVLGLLGNKVDFLGVFPKDTKDLFQKSACSFVRQEMERCGVGLEQMSLVGDSDLPYSSVVINDETGSRTILHCPGLLREVSFNFFQKLDLSAYSWIHFEGRNTEEVVKMICHVVKYNEGQDEANRVKMSVELEKPHRRNLPLLLPHADLVLISQEYARDSGYNNAPDTVKAFKDHVKSRCKTTRYNTLCLIDLHTLLNINVRFWYNTAI
ncbi:unnamed protein product [Clavelina lepadiformis]|uniref:Carbohydrate kinase PfkB domain-containing protein n=1 Tax=Clavelina lepadiformis TaxID=159417 RepID=A0ABP0FVX5_CLALP